MRTINILPALYLFLYIRFYLFASILTGRNKEYPTFGWGGPARPTQSGGLTYFRILLQLDSQPHFLYGVLNMNDKFKGYKVLTKKTGGRLVWDGKRTIRKNIRQAALNVRA